MLPCQLYHAKVHLLFCGRISFSIRGTIFTATKYIQGSRTRKKVGTNNTMQSETCANIHGTGVRLGVPSLLAPNRPSHPFASLFIVSFTFCTDMHHRAFRPGKVNSGLVGTRGSISSSITLRNIGTRPELCVHFSIGAPWSDNICMLSMRNKTMIANEVQSQTFDAVGIAKWGSGGILRCAVAR